MSKIKLLGMALLVAFFVREYTSGMNKICIYESVRGEHAITINAVALCPISIQV